MPLKWPADREPVIPDYTDITVCVAGLSALGGKTADVVYNAAGLPERFQRDTVDMNLMHAVISSRDGGQKGVRGDFRVFMNQVDDDIDRLAAAYRLQQIFAVMGIQSAWGSLKPDEPKIAIILEAAGDSKRFGSNKLLHIMDDGRPMIASILDAVRPLEAYKKILVTQYDEVAAMAPDLDVVMNDGSNGLEAAARIKAACPRTKIIIVTSMPDSVFLKRAREIGVDSFWYKEVQEKPLLEIMDRTMAGERVFPDKPPVTALGLAKSIEFTERELDVLRLLAEGLTDKEIADTLFLGVSTVRYHVNNLISKTGFSTRTELAVNAVRGGIVIPGIK